METVSTKPEYGYREQLDAWIDRHADTPVIKRYRPGTHSLIDYYEADHAEALLENQKRPTYGTVEYYAEMFKGERTIDWRAIQLIDTALISAEPAQQVIWVRNVLAALRAEMRQRRDVP